jgi:hypothetical protein
MFMVDVSLVGRCGLYCGACGIYRAYQDNGAFLEYVSKSWNIPKEKIHCNGCMALTPECSGSGCERVRCLDSKGYKFCFECPSFKERSCEKYEKLASRYLERGEDMRASLIRIEMGEVNVWLEEQDKRWRCPSCGHPISWFGGKCFNCGKPLID